MEIAKNNGQNHSTHLLPHFPLRPVVTLLCKFLIDTINALRVRYNFFWCDCVQIYVCMSKSYDFYVSDIQLFSHSEFSIRFYRSGLSLYNRSGLAFCCCFTFLAAGREPSQSSSVRLFCNDVVMLTELRIGRRLLLLLKFQ